MQLVQVLFRHKYFCINRNKVYRKGGSLSMKEHISIAKAIIYRHSLLEPVITRHVSSGICKKHFGYMSMTP